MNSNLTSLQETFVQDLTFPVKSGKACGERI